MSPVTFSPASRWMRLIHLFSSTWVTFGGAVGPPEDALAPEVPLLAEGVRQPGGHVHLPGPSSLGQGDVPFPLRAADVDDAPDEVHIRLLQGDDFAAAQPCLSAEQHEDEVLVVHLRE